MASIPCPCHRHPFPRTCGIGNIRAPLLYDNTPSIPTAIGSRYHSIHTRFNPPRTIRKNKIACNIILPPLSTFLHCDRSPFLFYLFDADPLVRICIQITLRTCVCDSTLITFQLSRKIVCDSSKQILESCFFRLGNHGLIIMLLIKRDTEKYSLLQFPTCLSAKLSQLYVELEKKGRAREKVAE